MINKNMLYNYDRLFKIGLYTDFVFVVYHVSAASGM